MARLLLVRHGISGHNIAHRMAGCRSDIDMAPGGYRQVEQLRERLAGEKIDVIYSSDLKRAMATAEILSKTHGVEIVPCPELREIDYGEVEGLTFEQINQQFPAIAELIRKFDLQIQFPGGEGFEEFAARTGKFLDRLEKHAPSDTILVTAHDGPLRTLICHLLGIGLEHWRQIKIDNASLTIIDTNPGGTIISLLNDTSHIREGKG